jgi:tight adherence protein C
VIGRSRVGHLVVDAVHRRRSRRHDVRIRREVPVTVDLLAVAVGAGCTPYGAVEVAAHWAPPEFAALLGAVPRACALGSSLGAALGQLADGAPALRPLAEALEASDRLGSPIGPALATLASEERAASRRRAETHARTVPVRLLFPLVFLVLPAFGLLTVVPAVLVGFSRT